jgi:hypothetical protein
MGMKAFVKQQLLKVKDLINQNKFFEGQDNTFGLNSRSIKKANSLGFTADEYMIYDLQHNNYKEYISEYERYKFRVAVKDYRMILDNKIVFYNIIRNYANTNMIFAYKVSGVFVPLQDGYEIENIAKLLSNAKKLVYKKLNSGGRILFTIL